jgi:hypothetical protein
MKQGLTYIAAILDRSSSMAPLAKETVQGFNNFIKEQKAHPGEALLTLCLFSDESKILLDGVPLGMVEGLTEATYAPNGWTALNDAVMSTIDSVGAKLEAMREEDRPSQVIVLIMTDGEENKSRLYRGYAGKRQVAEKIRHQRDRYSWEFVFIGANIDVERAALDFGILPQNAAAYTASAQGTSDLMRGLSSNMAHYRSAGAAQATAGGFFVDPIQQDDQAKVVNVNHPPVPLGVTTPNK